MVVSNGPQSHAIPRSLLGLEAGGPAGIREAPPYRPISPTLAMAPTVSVLIPARDEAANLPHVFGTLPSWVDEVVVVDGHSVDDTVAVSRALCPKVKVVTQPGRGKGDALRAGFAAATGDIIVTIDADGSADGAEVIRFVGALLAGADFAKGSRFANGGGSDDITALRRYGNKALSVLVNRMFGTHFTDLCYGYNAFWARHLDVIELSSGPGFEVETLMNIRAAQAGLTIYEVPSHESPRIFGDSNLHAIRDGWRILKVIVREWLSDPRTRGPRGAAPSSTPAARSLAPAVGTAAAGAPGTMGSPVTQPYRMPGYEREKSVTDREIVAAIADGDAAGRAAAFGRYGNDLYTYCRSLLTDPADAAGVVRDTFVIASAMVSRLPEPDRLRAWLFAVARKECHRRQRRAAPSSRLYEAAEAMDDTGSIAITGQAELRALVRAALAELDPADREISELNVRYGFHGADLAAILGVPRNKAHSLAARSRSRLERSLGVLPVAVSGRCRELTATLDGQAGSHSPGLSPRVKDHIRRCQVCRQRKRIGLNPAILLDLLPVVSMSAGLRRQVLDVLADEAPAAVAYRARLADRAARFGTDGFPVQFTAPSSGWRVTSLTAAAAAFAALALLGGAAYYADHLLTQGATAPAVHRPGNEQVTSSPGLSRLSARPGQNPARPRASQAPAPKPSTSRSKPPSSVESP